MSFLTGRCSSRTTKNPWIYYKVINSSYRTHTYTHPPHIFQGIELTTGTLYTVFLKFLLLFSNTFFVDDQNFCVLGNERTKPRRIENLPSDKTCSNKVGSKEVLSTASVTAITKSEWQRLWWWWCFWVTRISFVNRVLIE